MGYVETNISQTNTDVDWFDSDIIWEDFTQKLIQAKRHGMLKRKAAGYLKYQYKERDLLKKTRKIRRSSEKTERARGAQLTRLANWYLQSQRR